MLHSKPPNFVENHPKPERFQKTVNFTVIFWWFFDSEEEMLLHTHRLGESPAQGSRDGGKKEYVTYYPPL